MMCSESMRATHKGKSFENCLEHFRMNVLVYERSRDFRCIQNLKPNIKCELSSNRKRIRETMFLL